jgi:hypothetical protein
MPGVRTRSTGGAWLALVALALQLVLGFGHVHAPAAAQLQAQAAHHLHDGHDHPAPASHDDGLAADGCALCATLAMAAGGLAPAAPVLALPLRRAARLDLVAPTTAPAPLRRAPFHSRAPPVMPA